MASSQFLKVFIEDKSSYVPTLEEEKTISREGIKKFIFNKLTSSKFKASAVSPDYLQKVIEKIDLCVNHAEPIYLSLPFGATKNPYLPTAPGIDWAEVYNVAFIRNYLKPIAKVYKPGVILDYISVAVFEEKVNRIPVKDTATYDRQFASLINYYQDYLPPNFNLRFSRVEDMIPRKKIEEQLTLKTNELRKSWNSQPKEVVAYKLQRAKRNSLFNPADPHVNDLVLASALGHDAFCSECWALEASPWDKKYMITLGHTYTSGWAIHVKSAPGSTVNFWSGIGVLKKTGDRYIPTVLSPSQYHEATNKVIREKVTIFDQEFPNLQEIQVY